MCGEMEGMEKFKFLEVNMSKHFTRISNTSHPVKKAQQRLYFPEELKQARLPEKLCEETRG